MAWLLVYVLLSSGMPLGTGIGAEQLQEQPAPQESSASAQPDPRLQQVEKLNQRVVALYAEGKFLEAIPLATQQLELLEAALGSDTPEVAQSINDLAVLYDAQGEYAEAQRLHYRALALREKLFGPDHPAVAESLNNLAWVLDALGEYSVALAMSRRALSIREKALGPEHLAVATSLENVAGLLSNLGDLETPLGMYQRVLAIREKNLGLEHPEVATALNNLAFLLEDRGDYAAARPLYERALSIGERFEGAQNPSLATTISNLAHLLQAQGDYEAAKPLYKRALDIRERALGPEHPFVAQSLNNLAFLLEDLGEYTEARPLYERSLRIREKAFDSDAPDVATAVNNLAELLAKQGALKAAEALYLRALKIRETALGKEHAQVAETLSNLARLYDELGQRQQGSITCLRALRLFERSLGKEHPTYGRALKNCAIIDWHLGRVARSRQQLLGSASVLAKGLSELLDTLSIAEQRLFLEKNVLSTTSLLLSATRSGESLPEAYELLFPWKGLLVFSLRRQVLIAQLAKEPAHRSDVERLQDLRARIAGWYQNAGSIPLVEWAATMESLQAEKEDIERRLARVLGLGEPVRLRLSDLRKALKPGEAFVDIYRYDSTLDGNYESNRFVALLLSSDAGPIFVDLGPAKLLVGAVQQWRTDVLLGSDAEASWRNLGRIVWRPIARALPRGSQRVWISPDGELVRIPWHLLPDTRRGTRGVLLAQVDSARELLSVVRDTQGTPHPNARWLLLGDLNFGATRGKESAARFPPLPGTANELEKLREIAAGRSLAFDVLRGDDAVKSEVLTKLASATYVHFATHGFFYRELPESQVALSLRYRAALLPTHRLERVRSPLVESGLALSGANVRDSSTQEAKGLLTAEEIVGLNLQDSRLVTLSACDTGRGEEITGQGVMGLRASFIGSGARSVLMSLWKIPDDATAVLMTRFYENLLTRGLPKLEALLEAQDFVRSDPSGRFRDPVHWAGWALAGEAW